MSWTQTLMIIITFLGVAYYIHRDIQEALRKNSAKTNRLYEMFINLLKEGKK